MSFKNLLLAGALGVVSFNAYALTEITIYNQDVALLKKTNDVYLSNGINEVVFDEVARTAKPESVIIFGHPSNYVARGFVSCKRKNVRGGYDKKAGSVRLWNDVTGGLY